ncbi:MAG: ABC transporter permease [Methylomarinum sp.]|nr:ABC transporter permease [Methylococcales bacterium]NOR71493.1 ABC transporter permease [Methylomarinum sp.]
MKFIDWIGRRCIGLFFYIIDLTYFLLRALSVWQPHRNIFNRAVYSVFLDQLILNGINAIAIISFLAIVVGISIASQLVFIIVSITGAKDLVEILARLVLSEMGPLITGVVMVGRSCSGIVVDLGNTKMAGEIEPLQYLGINVDDYFVLPRIICMVISQVTLALYFSAIMLMFGMFFSVLIYDISAQESLSELLNLVTIDSLFRFMIKNLLFGLIVGTIACFHGLSVQNSPIQVSEQMHKAVVRSIVFLFLVDSYFIIFTL